MWTLHTSFFLLSKCKTFFREVCANIILLKLSILLLSLTLSIKTYSFDNFSDVIKVPSPTREIYSILKDRNEFIWLCSSNGLYRFDGKNYKHYSGKNIKSLEGSYLLQKDNVIWYSNFEGDIYFVKNDSLMCANPSISANVHSEFTVHDNILLFGSSPYTLTSINYKENTIINTPLPVEAIRFIRDKNELIALYEKGFAVYNVQGKLLFSKPITENTKLLDVLSYKQNYISVEQYNGTLLVYMNSISERTLLFKKENTIQPNNINIINDQVVIMSKNGLHSIDLNQPNINAQFLEQYNISDIILGPDESYWLSTLNSGIIKLPKKKNYIKHKLPNNNFRIKPFDKYLLLFDKNGNILNYDYQNKSIKHLFFFPQKYQIYDIIKVDSLPKLDRTNFSDILVHQIQNDTLLILHSGAKQGIIIDRKYLAAAVTGNIYLKQLHNEFPSMWDNMYSLLRSYKIEKNITPARVKSIAYSTNSGRLYYATSNGLLSFASDGKPNLLHYLNQPIFASGLAVYDSILYIHTSYGSILEYNTTNSTFNNNTRWNDLYYSKFIATQEYIITKSDAKISIYNLKSKLFYELPYLENANEFDDAKIVKNAIYITIDSALYETDLSVINSKLPFKDLIIDKISTDKKSYYSNTLSLSPPEKDISIHFSLPNFMNEIHSIEYKLDNEEWKNINPNFRELSLLSLPYGQHTLQFKINNRLSSQLVRFTLEKPFYLTHLFILLVLGGVFLLSRFAYNLRVKKVKQESALLLEKNEMQHKLRQSMLSSIKSQMNPHFIFNALNTIQSYIVTEDKERASVYLSKFSKLTRKILEMSDSNFVSIKEELDALLLYVELEKMRFDELNFTVEVDPNLNITTDTIPSMAIQPFVENAIKHGLLHKSGSKYLYIGMKKELNNLKVTIEDNGIGRVKSQQINKIKTHKSFSTNATNKRLELLKEENEHLGIQYTDKYNNQHQPIGTSVVLTIPLNKTPS